MTKPRQSEDSEVFLIVMIFRGAPKGTRTPDQLIKSQLLYQLSYRRKYEAGRVYVAVSHWPALTDTGAKHTFSGSRSPVGVCQPAALLIGYAALLTAFRLSIAFCLRRNLTGGSDPYTTHNSVNFYFTDVSEPSHVIQGRGVPFQAGGLRR